MRQMYGSVMCFRLKYSKVTAEVDLTLNPKLAKRFNLEECQAILLYVQVFPLRVLRGGLKGRERLIRKRERERGG